MNQIPEVANVIHIANAPEKPGEPAGGSDPEIDSLASARGLVNGIFFGLAIYLVLAGCIVLAFWVADS